MPQTDDLVRVRHIIGSDLPNLITQLEKIVS